MSNNLKKIISDIYGCPPEDAAYYEKRCAYVQERFSEVYGSSQKAPLIFSSPGRLELTGNHTDHQGGMVLTGATSLDMLACAAPNGTDTVNVWSEGYKSFSVNVSDTRKRPEEINTSQGLVRGVISCICKKGYEVKGFDMYAVSDVPGGLGMSSSACFEVMLGTVINELFCGGALSREELAFAAMFAENEYFGKPCGLMDQMACITGGINSFDFKNPDKPVINTLSFDFCRAGIDIVVIDTGTDHADMAADFNAIPGEMFAVAKALGVKRLCEADEELFLENVKRLRRQTGDRAVMRAMHWYAEVKRVKNQVAALEAGDISGFLTGVRESGRSSFMYLQNIDSYRNSEYEPVALSLAVAERLLDGKGAVRIQGGGFAGSIIAFVQADHADTFILRYQEILGEGSCRRVRIRKAGAVCVR